MGRESDRGRSTLRQLSAWLLAIALLAACAGPGPGQEGAPDRYLEDTGELLPVRGQVSFDPPDRVAPAIYRTQANLGEVANAATVSLIDAQTGNTVSSSVTDAEGRFVLTFKNFNPVSGAAYTLEAVKGLSQGGKPNRPGAPAVRVRTLLFWENGWLSLTNTTPGTGIMVGAATTAVATAASLKQSAGRPIGLRILAGRVSGSTYDETGTELSRPNDFDPVLALVGQALALDLDPVGAIAWDKDRGTYRLATAVPLAVGIEPAIPTPGQSLTVRGLAFDPTPGRSVFWFGQYPAATWSVSADRGSVAVAVPSAAYSAPFTLQQVGGIEVTLHPFLKLKGTVGTLAGNGQDASVDGVASAASFMVLMDLAANSSGDVYVADLGGFRIRKISAGVVSTLAGSGTTGFRDGPGATAQFANMAGVAVDAAGNVFVSDFGNARIRKIAPDGTVSTYAGTGERGVKDGPAGSAQFDYPFGLTADAAGNVWVVEETGLSVTPTSPSIRRISPDGTVSTVAGGGPQGFADGTGAAARFKNPIHLDLDGAGNLLLGDDQNHRIRTITAQGEVTTLAGSGNAGLQEGPAASASFNRPYAAVGVGGKVYVADMLNHRIRMVSGGQVSTLAGGAADFADGALAQARFSWPLAIAADAAGNLYVSDRGNKRIRVITP